MNIFKYVKKVGLASLLMLSLNANAALLNLPTSQPIIEFGATGLISYDADTGLVVISGVPASIFSENPFIFGDIAGSTDGDEKFFTIEFRVDQNGKFVSGEAGAPDLVIKGSADTDFDTIPDYDGVLLEADVADFGFQDGGATDDRFELRLNNIAGEFAPLFEGKDLVINITSEISQEFPNAFNGSFTTSFSGLAKGSISATNLIPATPLACHIQVDSSCSVNGKPNADVCRIKVSKSSKFWQHKTKRVYGRLCGKQKYGMHGSPIQWWESKYSKEDVKFTYVVTNQGKTPITDLFIDDSFDTGVTGLPATLLPGQSVTVRRTEKLNEELENRVDVFGKSGDAICTDSDIVEVEQIKKYSGHYHHGHQKDDDRDDDKKKRWSIWW